MVHSHTGIKTKQSQVEIGNWISVAIFGNFSRIWLLLTPFGDQNFRFGYLSILATFCLLLKIWLKTGFGSFYLCFDVDIFAFWKTFDVDILGFQKFFDVGLLGFSKVWLLFAQTFWQHWLECSCKTISVIRCGDLSPFWRFLEVFGDNFFAKNRQKIFFSKAVM